MASNPIDAIEAQQEAEAIGALLYRSYEGARQAGASRFEGLLVMVAYLKAILMGEEQING